MKYLNFETDRNMNKLNEYQTILWTFVLGVVLIVFGFYQFFEISALEEAGKTVRMKKALEMIYNVGGKYTILAIFELIGLICLYSFISHLRDFLGKRKQ